MLIGNQKKDLIDIRIQKNEFNFRFCNSFDESAKAFELEKVHSKFRGEHTLYDHSETIRSISWPNLSFYQSFRSIENYSSPYLFLQMSNEQTNSHYQVIIRIEISKIEYFKIGTINQWIINTDSNSMHDQQMLMLQLLYFCRKYTGIMNLRIQPYMPGEKKLESVFNLLSPLGFVDCAPKSYTKTRIIDLRPTLEEILISFSANGRSRLKIKQKETENVEIRNLINTDEIPFLQIALDASYGRSTKAKRPFNFQSLMATATQFADEVIMLGFYFKDAPFEPKAFVTGIKHDNIVEYSIGGSIGDARLRQYPFNHILIWQLAILSKQNSCEFLDLGGITDGSDNDSLRGITNFKRLFPGFEIANGREMEISLRPTYIFIYSLIKKILIPLTIHFSSESGHTNH